MSAVMGTLVGIKTMADGTPRITIDLSCSLAEIAALGCEPGAPFGLVRITQEAAKSHAQKEAVQAAENEKGGPLSKWAALRCKEQEFRAFLLKTIHGETSPTITENEAAGLIRKYCNVESRAELDSDPQAAKIFRLEIMLPWKNSPMNPYQGA